MLTLAAAMPGTYLVPPNSELDLFGGLYCSLESSTINLQILAVMRMLCDVLKFELVFTVAALLSSMDLDHHLLILCRSYEYVFTVLLPIAFLISNVNTRLRKAGKQELIDYSFCVLEIE